VSASPSSVLLKDSDRADRGRLGGRCGDLGILVLVGDVGVVVDVVGWRMAGSSLDKDASQVSRKERFAEISVGWKSMRKESWR